MEFIDAVLVASDTSGAGVLFRFIPADAAASPSRALVCCAGGNWSFGEMVMKPPSGASTNASRRKFGGVAGSVSVGVCGVWLDEGAVGRGSRVLIGGRTTACRLEYGLSGGNSGTSEPARDVRRARASACD